MAGGLDILWPQISALAMFGIVIGYMTGGKGHLPFRTCVDHLRILYKNLSAKLKNCLINVCAAVSCVLFVSQSPTQGFLQSYDEDSSFVFMRN